VVVPTAAQLRGDFSQTTTANGTPILIYVVVAGS